MMLFSILPEKERIRYLVYRAWILFERRYGVDYSLVKVFRFRLFFPALQISDQGFAFFLFQFQLFYIEQQ